MLFVVPFLEYFLMHSIISILYDTHSVCRKLVSLGQPHSTATVMFLAITRER